MSYVEERRKENPNFKRKPTNTEKRRRLDVVESLLIDCATVPEILRYFSEKENLRLSRRTIEGYVHIVEKRIQKAAEPKRELELRKAKRRLERCFARALTGTKKNVRAAIAAQQAINDLLGLYPAKDASDEMNMEQFAALVAVQRNEIELTRMGPEGLKREIVAMFQRVSATDARKLLKELSQEIANTAPNAKG